MNEKKCLGCGVLLQDENILMPGYTTNLENDFCQRCFRIKNYGEYQLVTNNNVEYMKMFYLRVLKKKNLLNILIIIIFSLMRLFL